MTTRLELTYQGETLTVTGEYFHQSPAEFCVMRVEQNGLDVTDHYRRHRTIQALEDMALEVIESD